METYFKSYQRGFRTDTFQRNYSALSDTTSHQNAGAVKTNSLNGFKNPNWRSQVKSRQNATTALSADSWSCKIFPVFVHAEYYTAKGALGLPRNSYIGTEISGTLQYQSYYNPFYTSDASLVTNVTNRCIRKFLEKAERVRSAVEAGQDFGEYRETIESLLHPFGSLRKHVFGYFDKLSKARSVYRRASDLSKVLADTYLEFNFGWKPLVSDIQDAYEGLQSRYKPNPVEVISSSARGTSHATFTNRAVSFTGGVANTNQNILSYSEYYVRYKAGINTGVRPNGLISVPQSLQLDLPHFLPTVWDLIPYSWIVDYFTNVGDIIRAYSTIDVSFAWGVKTIRQVGKTVCGPVMLTAPFYTPSDGFSVTRYVSSGGNAEFSNTHLNRSALSKLDCIPSFSFMLPLSIKPWENIAALLVSRGRSLVPFY